MRYRYYKTEHPKHGTTISRKKPFWKGIQIYLPHTQMWTEDKYKTTDMNDHLIRISEEEAFLELV